MLVRDFTVYFSNLKAQLLKFEFEINPVERKCEDCWYRALWAVDAAFEANSCTEIDSGLEAVVCGMTEYAGGLSVGIFCGFTISPLKVLLICFLLIRRAFPIVIPNRRFILMFRHVHDVPYFAPRIIHALDGCCAQTIGCVRFAAFCIFRNV